MTPGPSPGGSEAGTLRRPSRWLLLSEPWRSAADLGALTLMAPQLASAPRGSGHPVLVLPGLLGSDASTLILRRFLHGLGHRPVGWGLGVNVGPDHAVVTRLPRLLAELTQRHGGPVSLVGWSLGGIFARALAAEHPEHVRQVITLGSPYAGEGPGVTHADAAYRLLSSRHTAASAHGRRTAHPPSLAVPTTSIYSRLDGIVSWRVCREEVTDRRQSIGVPASHLGFGHNPAVLWVVADRLARDPDDWAPFVPPAWLRRVVAVDRPA